MRQIILPATALTLILAACSGGEDGKSGTDPNDSKSSAAATDDGGAAQSDVGVAATVDSADSGRDLSVDRSAIGATSASGERIFARIPSMFRGTWASGADFCRDRNHERFTVDADSVDFFEGGGIARDIRGNGNSLAVTYAEQQPGGDRTRQLVYFAREATGRMRVRLGNNASRDYMRCGSTATGSAPEPTGAADEPIVPARFRGLYAFDRKACAEDYNYNPSFQNVSVSSRKVSFFETGGPVTNVNVSGNAIAITLRERVGDSETVRAIYLALNGDGTVRYRSGDDAPRTYLKC